MTGMRSTRIRSAWARAVPVLLVTALVLVGCGSAKSTAGGSGAAGQTTTAAPAPLRILVTNDDGYSAKGIDAVVEALRALPDTQVTVVAPKTNQSGTDGNTTPGPLTAADVTTASGYPAKAVDGFPADTIAWAIDQHGIDFTPDLVVSGINFGQNIGAVVNISGTVGAARAAAARGIPALAASQGLGDPTDFPAGVAQVMTWLASQRTALMAGSDRAPVLLQNLNTPTCTAGSVRGLAGVPIAGGNAGADLGRSDCTSTATEPVDDVVAFAEGYATLSPLPLIGPTSGG
jgi:5'-nucleotidase